MCAFHSLRKKELIIFLFIHIYSMDTAYTLSKLYIKHPALYGSIFEVKHFSAKNTLLIVAPRIV